MINTLTTIYKLHNMCGKEIKRYNHLKASYDAAYWKTYKKKVHYRNKIIDILEDIGVFSLEYYNMLVYLDNREYDKYIMCLQNIIDEIEKTIAHSFHLIKIFSDEYDE